MGQIRNFVRAFVRGGPPAVRHTGHELVDDLKKVSGGAAGRVGGGPINSDAVELVTKNRKK